MTDPRHAYNEPGRGRWYKHPVTGESWPSVTNVLDTAISKPALVPWAAKITAEKAWQVLPQMVYTSRRPTERDALHKEIKGEVRIVKDMAADLGDRVHKRAEAHVLGKPYPEDEEVEPFALQLVRFLEDFGVDFDNDIEASEATVINRAAGYAGTGDLWLWMRIKGKRRLMLLDLKTSSTRPADSVFTEMGLQLAALAKGETVLLDDGTEVDPPTPIDGTAILNLRKDNYALIPMPYDGDLDAAFIAFCGALRTAEYMHGHYGEKPIPMPKPTLKVA